MIKIYQFIILVFLFISCGDRNVNQSVSNNSKKDSFKLNTWNKNPQKTTINYLFDGSHYHWTAKHPDTTNYLCEITFYDEYLIYWYHGQCQYYYFTYRIGQTNTIQMIWSYKTDCILDMDFLEKSNGIKRHPKAGDNFATYNLINDTTIHVVYDFPEWTRKINAMTKDSIFPSHFYVKR